jgi:hypothetical protein
MAAGPAAPAGAEELMPVFSCAVAAVATFAFALLLLFSASLPCHPDQTIVVGGTLVAGCR